MKKNIDHSLDLKVLEFLNVHFNTLESLDQTLETVYAQELKKLEQVEQGLEQTKKEAQEEFEILDQRYSEVEEELNRLQINIPTLKQDILEFDKLNPSWFEELLEETKKFHRLDQTINFLEIVYEGLKLSEEAKKSSLETEVATLESLNTLLRCLERVRMFNPKGKGFGFEAQESIFGLNFLYYLEYQVEVIKTNIQNSLISKYEASLKEFGWPKPIDLPALADEQPQRLELFKKRFVELIKLQINFKDLNPINDIECLNVGFLPIDLILKPIQLRFRYHFMGSRSTNTLEKPEWFLSFLIQQLKDHLDFLDALQALLPNDALALDFRKLFVEGIRRLGKLKLERVKETVFNHAPYLTSFIKELLETDAELEEVFMLYPNLQKVTLANIYLDNREIFKQWISYERDFVEQRLDHFLELEDAWEPILPENQGGTSWQAQLNSKKALSEAERPTVVVEKIVTLFEAILERYRLLHPFSLRLRYFTGVQLVLLERFYAGLNQIIDRFDSRFRSLRALTSQKITYLTIHSVTPLRGVVDSTQFLLPLLRDWDTQPFFLEMWAVIYPERVPDERNEYGQGLFDDLIQGFEALLGRIDSVLVEALFRDVSYKLNELDAKLPGSLVIFEEPNNLDDPIETLASLKAESLDNIGTETGLEIIEIIREPIKVLECFHPSLQRRIIEGFSARLEPKVRNSLLKSLGIEETSLLYEALRRTLSIE